MSKQLAIFRQYSVEPYFASIPRFGKVEKVVVVAQKAGEVIYWEDVEEGFDISRLGSDGCILEHWCNDGDLGVALNRLIQPLSPEARILDQLSRSTSESACF